MYGMMCKLNKAFQPTFTIFAVLRAYNGCAGSQVCHHEQKYSRTSLEARPTDLKFKNSDLWCSFNITQSFTFAEQ